MSLVTADTSHHNIITGLCPRLCLTAHWPHPARPLASQAPASIRPALPGLGLSLRLTSRMARPGSGQPPQSQQRRMIRREKPLLALSGYISFLSACFLQTTKTTPAKTGGKCWINHFLCLLLHISSVLFLINLNLKLLY